MANQVDNILVNDDTTGLSRSIIVATDNLFLSVDLTLQGTAVLTADNIKRGTSNPNSALVAGNEGDLYQQTTASGGTLWINTDGTTTGWANALGQGWSDVLANSAASGGTSPIISSGDSILGEDVAGGNAGAVPITGGSVTSGNGNGGNVVLAPGTGSGTGVDGIVQVNGIKIYASSATDPLTPTPSAGDRYYNTVLNEEMVYDASRSKWLTNSTTTFQFGRNGNTGAGVFYRGVNGLVLSATRGWPAFFNGTVIALGYTRGDVDVATFQVTANGTTLSSLSSSATSGVTTTLNNDFVAGDILAVRNAAGGNTTSTVQGWVRVKWRV